MNAEEAVGGAGVAPVHQVAYVPFDFRVGVFVGPPHSPNDPLVEEWVQDVQGLFKSLQTPEAQQPQLIMKYLGGEAKRVVQVMEPDDREDSQTILERLLEVYGDRTPASSLLQRFHNRQQNKRETVREFSLSLQETLGRLRKRDPEAVPRPDLLLRDRFLAGLRHSEVKNGVEEEARHVICRDEKGSPPPVSRHSRTGSMCAGVNSSSTSPCAQPKQHRPFSISQDPSGYLKFSKIQIR